MSELTALLIARSSFWEGVGRTIDFAGTLSEYNRLPTGPDADALALASDWRAIGEDLMSVMDSANGQASESAK